MQDNSVSFERKHLIFLVKGSLEKSIPIITQITAAVSRGLSVSVICTDCNRELKDILNTKGVKVYCSKHLRFGSKIIRKVTDWLGVRLKFHNTLNKLYKNGDLLYIGSLDTALCLGKRLLKYNYILHIRELYDKYPQYLYLIRPYAQAAKVVVVSEYCRAAILKSWLCLDKSPFVIPNKPYDHPQEKNCRVFSKSIRNMLDEMKDKKIILYQGNISRERGLLHILRAIAQSIDDSYVILLMGVNHKNYIEEIQNECSNIYYIEYIPAPLHLQVTSHAYIGLVAYGESSLNNIFCAPNKIYEYCGFGIPVLGNDIPGLRYTIGYNDAGLCVDFNDPVEVMNALHLLEEKYDYYSEKAKEFFEHTDMGELFDKLLSMAGGED